MSELAKNAVVILILLLGTAIISGGLVTSYLQSKNNERDILRLTETIESNNGHIDSLNVLIVELTKKIQENPDSDLQELIEDLEDDLEDLEDDNDDLEDELNEMRNRINDIYAILQGGYY